jgi:type IV secretion system protein VirB10
MTELASQPTAPTKLDPESLVLRGSPARVVRFRKGAIVAITALTSAAMIGVAWYGLSPSAFRMVAANPERLDTALPPDELANAPKGYGEIPRLGPPLPGDLGRPILEHQRAAMATAGGAVQPDQAIAAERSRAASDLKAARESAVMMQIATPGGPLAAKPQDVPAAAEFRQDNPAPAAAGLPNDPNAQQRKIAFLRQGAEAADVNPHRLAPAPSPYLLTAGTIISASLITGLNSDLPGLVTAQVTENAFDTATGRILLLPQGTRVIGRYDSVVAFGQSRALVVWERLILPDGSSIRIDNMPASDTSGYAGLADMIDRHSFQILKGVALSTLLGLGTELSLGGDDGDIVSALRRSAQQSGARAGDQLVGRSLDIQPTIRVRPGWPLRIVVNKDIVLRPWRSAEA